MSDQYGWQPEIPPLPQTGQQPQYPPQPQYYAQPQGYPQQPQWYGPVPPGAQPRRSKKWWWIGGSIAAVVILVAGAVTAVVLKSGPEGGADTPEAAVLDFLAALENEDPFAAANLLDPAEQQQITRMLDNAQQTAQDTTFQEGDDKTSVLQGVAVSTDDIHTEVDEIGDGVARVTITDGTLTVAFDPAEADDGIKDLLGDDDEASETWTVDDMVDESDSGDEILPSFMTIQDDGKWYVSLVYSWADRLLAKRDDAPTRVEQADTQSFDSPEAAAQGFVEAMVASLNDGDIESVAQAVSPNNGRLLLTYEPLFKEMEPQDVEIVGDPEFSVDTDGDSSTVTVNNLELDFTDDDGNTETAVLEDDCITVDDDTRCDSLGLNPFATLVFSPRKTGFVVAKDSTGWHVDPVATYLSGAADILGSASKQEVAVALADWFNLSAALLRLDADETVEPGDSTSVTLTADDDSLDGIGVAVVDIPVHSDDYLAVTVDFDSDADASWQIVGESGQVASGSYYPETNYFYPPDSETLKLVIWGTADERVDVSVEAS